MVCVPDGNIGGSLVSRKYQKKYYMTWRNFFIKLLRGKCTKCGRTDDLEIDHIIPVENNKMSGSGRNNRLQDWREQYLKGNLQLMCKEHNLDKREFKNNNGGLKMSEELSFEGILESIEEKIGSITQKKFVVVKCQDLNNNIEKTFSVFSTKLMDKMRGKEGNKLTIKYKKSADGQYNNVTNVFFEGETDMVKIMEDTYKELWGICVKLKKYLDSVPTE